MIHEVNVAREKTRMQSYNTQSKACFERESKKSYKWGMRNDFSCQVGRIKEASSNGKKCSDPKSVEGSKVCVYIRSKVWRDPKCREMHHSKVCRKFSDRH